MEKILVLLATYNGEKYLREQLDSIFAQQGVQVSVLARDDGSSDGTKEILQEYSLSNDLKWYSGKHLNVQKGYFELMSKAAKTGYHYFAFSDQDDVWDRDKLRIALDRLKEYTKPALYYSGQRLVDENLNYIEDHRLNQYRTAKTRFVLSDFAGCTGVFNKDLIDEVISFEPNYMLMHDTWILRVCLALGGEIIVDTEPRMDYRQHSGNILGLGHSLKATIKQVKQYITEYKVEEVTKELIRGYGNRMVPEYKQIAEWICSYKSNLESKRALLDKNNIDFCNRGLNLTYKLKVKLKKL